MNRVANRAWGATILAVALFLGLCVIVLRYVRDSQEWFLHQSNATVYTNGHLNSGKVYDRTGQLLVDASDGREYPEDALLRSSTLHLLGDVQGNIPDYIFENYSDELTSYDLFGGSQSTQDVTMELTVHAQIQKAAQAAMEGRKGTIGIYNYKTGEILCMVSGPNFDPEDPSVVDDSEAYSGVYVNRFLHSTYTPGSTFKLVTSAAAIGEIEDLDSRTFLCEGSVVVNNEEIECNSVHGTVDFDTAVSKSCNVAFAHLAVELGAETLQRYVEDIGITERLYFDGFRTAQGSVDLDNIPDNILAWTGIGQAKDQINPCQYMVYMGAIANGGTAAKPYVVSRIRCGQEETYRVATTMCKQMIQPEIAERLDKAMHTAVVNSYGVQNFAGCYAGAKTGTAQRGGSRASDSLLTGYLKDENCPLAFIVIIEEGGYGGTTCLPILRQVLNATVTALGLE